VSGACIVWLALFLSQPTAGFVKPSRVGKRFSDADDVRC